MSLWVLGILEISWNKQFSNNLRSICKNIVQIISFILVYATDLIFLWVKNSEMVLIENVGFWNHPKNMPCQ